MKVLVLMISTIILSSPLYSKECNEMEPIDPGFGECLEQELLSEAIDGLNKTDFDIEAREIASIDMQMEEIDNLPDSELEAWDGDNSN